ncbi:MAG TPA: TetR family transcriptional regulator [Trebonia sp.]|nr:TetR family transcriptional regulator [Trebonia sp.]
MPELPTTPRGAATSRRILDAATQEFAERGIAGARIDRIIAAARTNKAQLYGYFGSKDGLFDAVISDCIGRTTTDVPFDARDLPGWAEALYNENLRSPDLVRLLAWARLERRPTGFILSNFDPQPKIAAIAEAQAAGQLRPGNPVDLLTLVIGMASAWSPATGIYVATAGEPAGDHDRRRALLRDSVQRAVAAEERR